MVEITLDKLAWVCYSVADIFGESKIIKSINVLKNVGKFDDGAPKKVAFEKLTFIYAENGRGKTTLTNILRSLANGDEVLIEDRTRLSSKSSPHIVIEGDKSTYVYEENKWNVGLPNSPDIAVFDDMFIEQNVCSGVEVDVKHRRGLNGLIIGSEGVKLNSQLKEEKDKIDKHRNNLKEIGGKIQRFISGNLSPDRFCDLKLVPDIEKELEGAKKQVEAVEEAEEIKKKDNFETITLPMFDMKGIESVLEKDLPDLEEDAVTKTQEHIEKLGEGGESWVDEGMKKIDMDSRDKDKEDCPFCDQNLSGSQLIDHYRGYFSEAYSVFKNQITVFGQGISSRYSDGAIETFEYSIRDAKGNADFWRRFMEDTPSVDIDTIKIAKEWREAREIVLEALRDKFRTPLNKIYLSKEKKEVITTYENRVKTIATLSGNLKKYNEKIASFKDKTSTGNLSGFKKRLEHLKNKKARHSKDAKTHCDSYLKESRAKKAAEERLKKAQIELDQYREDIFPKYTKSINDYLDKFFAEFGLSKIEPKNDTAGASCEYGLLIDKKSVPLKSGNGASFKNTLSSGDRSTLALAFFFASLDKDSNLANKIVVIDDPFNSLDQCRSSRTIEHIVELTERTKQVIVLSHSKHFLCELWEEAEKSIRDTEKKPIEITRVRKSSVFEDWEVNKDLITDHDTNHALVRSYVEKQDRDKKTEVAKALRPMLEAYLRVAYPKYFLPGGNVGKFIDEASKADEGIIANKDIKKLRSLNNYSNKFHHMTDGKGQRQGSVLRTVTNDDELVGNCIEVLDFIKRPLPEQHNKGSQQD